MFTYRQQIKTQKLCKDNLYELEEEFMKLVHPDELLRPSDCGLCAGCIENHIHGGMECCEGPPNSYRLWYSEIEGLLKLVQNNYNTEWGIMNSLQEQTWRELSYYWKVEKKTIDEPQIYTEDLYDSDDSDDSPQNSLNTTWR